ncbi:hypothetical protein GCM10010174_30240 [Kutzneria viridogrisea]|uniref:Uncharacterized protein n=2 Tax=Kutzneria TaxID=43356 RepID=A0ABR6BPZ7_9PSEU|nr:hypothetical protein [Kutzneria albida]AHH93632.1 putative secreted protein [Kutzneria albida DSM 43870]MBA8928984.1 hypothetical protein [Kutzneria viridogrisea]
MLALLIALGLILVLSAGVVLRHRFFGSRPQHADAGEGALNVSDLRVRLAFEAGQRSAATGRHHLSER